jgi:coproporphyrinogen III oxidase
MDVNEYKIAAQETALEGFKRLNNTSQVEHRKFDFPSGSWEVNVVRGKVLEKATFSRVKLFTKHPYTGEDTQFDTIQAKAYPANPKVPILLFVQEHMVSGDKTFFSGMVDVAPVAAREEHLRFLDAEIRKIVERHGADFQALRKKEENIYKLEQWAKPVNGAVGIHMPTEKELFGLIRDAGLNWLKLYCTVVEKSQNEPFTSEDMALRDSVWSKIMEYYYLGDISINAGLKIGIPLEATNLSLLAPTLKY